VENQVSRPHAVVVIELDCSVFSADAALKTCYWFSKDFAYEVSRTEPGRISISLTPKHASAPSDNLRAEFVSMATDFTLRERIETQTSPIRELLLAKAFAESGVLEDSPEGVFGDKIEEERPDGLFKILSNG
jgi:His-Xaa-Ser system protein HxsD